MRLTPTLGDQVRVQVVAGADGQVDRSSTRFTVGQHCISMLTPPNA
nr:putative integron gene cassette protein [uncultured bacterium]